MAKTTRTATSIPAAVQAEVKRLRSELTTATDEYYNVVHCMMEQENRYGFNETQAARNDATVATMQANQQAIRNQIAALLGKTAAHAA